MNVEVPVRILCKCRGLVGKVECFLCEGEGCFQVWVEMVTETVKLGRNYTFEWPLLTLDPKDVKRSVKAYKEKRKKLWDKRPKHEVG